MASEPLETESRQERGTPLEGVVLWHKEFDSEEIFNNALYVSPDDKRLYATVGASLIKGE